jgi:hypothetical protein
VPLAGDFNGDGVVDRIDAAILLRNLGRTGDSHRARGDTGGDRSTTLTDLAFLQSNLGNTFAPSAPAASAVVPDSRQRSSVQAIDAWLAELSDLPHDTDSRRRIRSIRAGRITGISNTPPRGARPFSPDATVRPAHRTLLSARRPDRAVRLLDGVLSETAGPA